MGWAGTHLHKNCPWRCLSTSKKCMSRKITGSKPVVVGGACRRRGHRLTVENFPPTSQLTDPSQYSFELPSPPFQSGATWVGSWETTARTVGLKTLRFPSPFQIRTHPLGLDHAWTMTLKLIQQNTFLSGGQSGWALVASNYHTATPPCARDSAGPLATQAWQRRCQLGLRGWLASSHTKYVHHGPQVA